MTAITTKNLQIFNAEQFKESVSETDNSGLYLTYGRSIAWDDENTPPTANTSINTHYEIWKNMIGGKLITGNDIAHVIPRIDWTSGITYNAYSHESTALFNEGVRPYVLTSDWNVYKCIENANNRPSTYEPSSIDTENMFQTADGYIWKYMYSVGASDQVKFTTDTYMPVKTLTEDDNSLQWQVQENALNGGIHSIIVVNAGNGFTNANAVTITITGDGAEANAYANVNTTSNVISSIIVDNPGAGYTWANVTITSAAGANANLKAIISPPGGHGSDPLRELGGSYLIINPRLRGTENDILTTNHSFRQIALIKDPYKYATTEVSSNAAIMQMYTLTLNGFSVDYQVDESVYQGASLNTSTWSAKVVEWDSSNSTLRLTNAQGTVTTDVLIGANSGASKFIDSITYPDLVPYSGSVLYVENIEAIERDADQTEDFKIILRM